MTVSYFGMPPRKAGAATVQDTLKDGAPAAQANILLDLIEYISEGKPVASVVADVCKVRAIHTADRDLLRCSSYR